MAFGAYGLSRFLSGRNELIDSRYSTTSSRVPKISSSEKESIRKQKTFDLEKEHEEMMKKLDLNAWTNKKIEKPVEN
eukprot:CAMPEP_0174253410 /NCGR_PEP_ID=MMETSP0439-20130205/2786_1 /TAXON_ID=0 /ORGANISM="Stereomyxa ramosa, Strain Chinc5" /LENGTH=76 /DNA_ID=CAMNT_0015334423 /DNA_START=55 /DNA_END=285 /DNA_ORIENTATION=-